MSFPILRMMLESSDVMLRVELIAIVLGLCFAVFYFFQKISPKYLFGDDGPYAGYIYNAMGVIYSILFAFITVLVWQSYNNVADSVAKEANHLNNMYRLYSAFPPEFDQSGKQALKAYTNTVIKEEWPLLSKDKFSEEAFKQMLAIELAMIKYKPQSPGEINAHQKLLQLYMEYAELRRSRIYNAQFALAYPAWFGLISSSYVFLFFSCLFKMKSKRTHIVMTIFLGLTIAGALYFLILYIHPFLGPMAISSAPFQDLLDLNWKF